MLVCFMSSHLMKYLHRYTLLLKDKIKDGALLISDWKKDTWNGLKIDSDVLDAVRPISAVALSHWSGPLYHLPARKGWQKPPDDVIELNYSPQNLAKLLHFPKLLKSRQSVELYHSGINSFQKWTPDRHRAAVIPS